MMLWNEYICGVCILSLRHVWIYVASSGLNLDPIYTHGQLKSDEVIGA